jgi:hypothetical protein
MDENGAFYFSIGENRLYFYLDEKLFYFYELKGEGLLKDIFKSVPKIPLINSNIEYDDVIPLEFRVDKLQNVIMQMILPFNYKLFNQKTVYKKENLKISSVYGEVYFSFYDKGFMQFKFDEYELKRITE